MFGLLDPTNPQIIIPYYTLTGETLVNIFLFDNIVLVSSYVLVIVGEHITQCLKNLVLKTYSWMITEWSLKID